MRKQVIIIDDSKFLIRQISDFMEKVMEFEVIATGFDGIDAVELYRKNKPDLLTLDITMPNKDGLSAIKEILSEFPEANILMISAVRGDAMLECMSVGAKGYIEKPLKFGDDAFVEEFKESINSIFKK
jgi:two-component system chemotaxis response regulator CheY